MESRLATNNDDVEECIQAVTEEVWRSVIFDDTTVIAAAALWEKTALMPLFRSDF